MKLPHRFSLPACLVAALGWLAPCASGQPAEVEYNRSVSASTIEIVASAGGTGWEVLAGFDVTGLPDAVRDLSSVITVRRNGQVVSGGVGTGATHRIIVGPGQPGGPDGTPANCSVFCQTSCSNPCCGICFALDTRRCVCVTADTFQPPYGPGYRVRAPLPELFDGDVIEVSITAAAMPGVLPEIDTSDDSAAVVIAMPPSPPAYNRSILATDIRYGRKGGAGGWTVTGEVTYDVFPGEAMNLACSLTLYVNGVPVGGGLGGGPCGGPGEGGTVQRITVGQGLPMDINLWDCSLFCATYCVGSDVNICTPPNVSPGPMCVCDQHCIPFRLTHFSFPVPELGTHDVITLRLTPLPGALPEIVEGDDTVSVISGQIYTCFADFNGHDGVTVQDIYDFLAAWNAGSEAADFNGFSGTTVQDIYDFLGAWNAGCIV